MRAALFGAGCVLTCVVLAGLVLTAAAISRARRDDDDWSEATARGYRDGGIRWLLQEVSGQ